MEKDKYQQDRETNCNKTPPLTDLIGRLQPPKKSDEHGSDTGLHTPVPGAVRRMPTSLCKDNEATRYATPN